MRQTESSSIQSRWLFESSLHTRKVRDHWVRRLGNGAEDERDLLFRYCYCPEVDATASTDVNFTRGFVNNTCVTSKMA